MNRDIAIIRTGTANLASVVAGLRRLTTHPRVVDMPSQLGAADAVVLPGVGAFASGMTALRQGGWDSVLRSRWETGAPTLAICLGLQLLCRQSEESPGVDGLGILPARVVALPESVSVPHLGWNQLNSVSEFFPSERFYFANSFCVAEPAEVEDAGWEIATTQHGHRFLAAARCGSWMACQFHPELSSQAGQLLLSRWMDLWCGIPAGGN